MRRGDQIFLFVQGSTSGAFRGDQRINAPIALSPSDRIRIGGFTPLTSIDYPGELAAVLFCLGCPWRCAYCQNPELILQRSSRQIPWGDILSFLERRRGLLDAVVFSGGEPTLQGGLVDALRQVRERVHAAISVGERERGVASVSAPVRSPRGRVVAAVSVSGPIDRLTRQPGRLHAPAVVEAGRALSGALEGGASGAVRS